MNAVLEATALGKRYGRRWALLDRTIAIPEGKVVGLVGPNGAGKTTLLHLAVGLLAPTTGSLKVLGAHPAQGPEQLAKVGFVAQDTPTYMALTVADHLRLGAGLNSRWDSGAGEKRIQQIGLDSNQRVRSLSGGQRAQLALTMAIAKRPELLILDEPVASLDPLARREFLEGLSQVVSDHGVSVILSSHLVADLERVCDYVVVLVASRVRVAGAIDELLSLHRHVTGPRRDLVDLPTGSQVIGARHTEVQSTFLVRGADLVVGPEWTVEKVNLEDMVLAYMGHSDADGNASSMSQSGLTS